MHLMLWSVDPLIKDKLNFGVSFGKKSSEVYGVQEAHKIDASC